MRACCSRLRPPFFNMGWGDMVVRPESGSARGTMIHGSFGNLEQHSGNHRLVA